VLVEARRDGPEMLELVEEALDAVAQPVDGRAERRRVGAMIERADVGIGSPVRDPGAQRVAVVAAIGEQDAVRPERTQHVLATLSVVRLAFGQLQRDGEPVAVDERVDLGRKPAAGTSHATAEPPFLPPLAACW